MSRFQYKGRSAEGKAVTGTLEAASSGAAATQLFTQGITPIDIVAGQDDSSQTLADLQQRLFSKKPGLEDLALFSRQMYTLLRAGVPILRAVNGLANNARNPRMGEALHDIVRHLEGGRELSTAMHQHTDIFSSLFVSITQVGETTGQLDEAFLQLSHYLEGEREIRDRIKSALRYPITVLGFIMAAMVIINVYVIPQFAHLFNSFKAELPLPTRILMATSDAFVNYWPYMLGILIVGIITLVRYVKTYHGRLQWDRFKLKIPYTGSIIFRATLARYARSFAMSLRAGVPLIQSLNVVSLAVDNRHVGEKILSMRQSIERGDTLTRSATATEMFTPLVLQMLAVGEETGNVEELLQEVAEFYEREVDYDLKKLSSAIEPVLIVIIGAMVLVLALGIFLPMWDLTSAIKR